MIFLFCFFLDLSNTKGIRVLFYLLMLALYLIYTLIRNETDSWMTVLRPFLAIFSLSVCSSFTKLRFRRSFWGGNDSKLQLVQKLWRKMQIFPFLFLWFCTKALICVFTFLCFVKDEHTYGKKWPKMVV